MFEAQVAYLKAAGICTTVLKSRKCMREGTEVCIKVLTKYFQRVWLHASTHVHEISIKWLLGDKELSRDTRSHSIEDIEILTHPEWKSSLRTSGIHLMCQTHQKSKRSQP